jgi:PEP-CTERM putative exosortase interaction domain
MKKLILTVVATSFGISLFAQGTVVFINRSANLSFSVYEPFPGNPFLSQIGNGPGDIPPGTTDWTGFTKIGAHGETAFAQLLGAPGYNVPESGLLPGSPVTSFRTGTLGVIVPITETFNNIPLDAPQATLEMVAWDNSSGLYPTWTEASVAWHEGLIFAGNSGTWNQDNMGGVIYTPPYMINSTDPTQHARSFNLYLAPEPTTAALAGLGATTLLILRRRR